MLGHRTADLLNAFDSRNYANINDGWPELPYYVTDGDLAGVPRTLKVSLEPMNLVCSPYRVALTLLLGISVVQAAEVTDPRLVEMTSCSLETSISQSPANYLIAIAEHTGDAQCNKQGCSETLKVVRAFAYQGASSAEVPDHIVAIILPMGLAPGGAGPTPQPPPKGQRDIGIYLPVPHGSNYYSSGVSTPVTSEIEAIFELATRIAIKAPADRPDCKNLFTPARRVERPTPEYFHVYAKFHDVPDIELIKTADSVLVPLGYARKSEGTTYPMPEVKGIFAFYTNDGPSSLLIVAGKVPGCTSIAMTDYGESSRGRANGVGGALIDELRKKYPHESTFYSDEECTNAL